MKAKVGDRIVITNAQGTQLGNEDNGKSATVYKVDNKCVWIKANELYPSHFNDIVRWYVLHDCYELEAVYNSPLYQALR